MAIHKPINVDQLFIKTSGTDNKDNGIRFEKIEAANDNNFAVKSIIPLSSKDKNDREEFLFFLERKHK